MAFAGFGLAATVGISGCGAGSDSAEGGSGSGSGESAGTPKEKVAAAFQNFENSSSAGFTLKLDSSTADIEKINTAQDSADKLTAQDKKEIAEVLKGKVTLNVTAPEGKTFADTTDSSAANSKDLLKDPAAFEAALKDSGSVAMSVVYGDSGLVDFATKDGVFYLRTDADKIAELADQNLSSATGMLGQLPPVIATPAEKLLGGEWVSLDMVKAVQVLDQQGLLDQLASADEGTAAGMAADPAAAQNLVRSLAASYDSDSQVTEVDGGYQVSVPVEKTTAAVKDDLVDLLGQDAATDLVKELNSSPTENVVFTVKVDDDKLTGLNLDLVQFLDKPVDDATFAVDLAIDPEASEVQVPSGATAIDIEGILNLIPADTLTSLGSEL
ncbi:hypothetical protein KIH74_21010 [Kineosporia sp. J2-2]|uniref:Lipoprotein n=1 Tax=Kineosporia corallincola TaxID=2835133 RepID=A0ABS5TK89_9ACTN|nr:hypothetical protein [Kineosporia corallincola]MBT0771430.1 hypothetical protein [Kineosporia corallincola]